MIEGFKAGLFPCRFLFIKMKFIKLQNKLSSKLTCTYKFHASSMMLGLVLKLKITCKALEFCSALENWKRILNQIDVFAFGCLKRCVSSSAQLIKLLLIASSDSPIVGMYPIENDQYHLHSTKIKYYVWMFDASKTAVGCMAHINNVD